MLLTFKLYSPCSGTFIFIIFSKVLVGVEGGGGLAPLHPPPPPGYDIYVECNNAEHKH